MAAQAAKETRAVPVVSQAGLLSQIPEFAGRVEATKPSRQTSVASTKTNRAMSFFMSSSFKWKKSVLLRLFKLKVTKRLAVVNGNRINRYFCGMLRSYESRQSSAISFNG
jgi:hypothetical protein